MDSFKFNIFRPLISILTSVNCSLNVYPHEYFENDSDREHWAGRRSRRGSLSSIIGNLPISPIHCRSPSTISVKKCNSRNLSQKSTYIHFIDCSSDENSDENISRKHLDVNVDVNSYPLFECNLLDSSRWQSRYMHYATTMELTQQIKVNFTTRYYLQLK